MSETKQVRLQIVDSLNGKSAYLRTKIKKMAAPFRLKRAEETTNYFR